MHRQGCVITDEAVAAYGVEQLRRHVGARARELAVKDGLFLEVGLHELAYQRACETDVRPPMRDVRVGQRYRRADTTVRRGDAPVEWRRALVTKKHNRAGAMKQRDRSARRHRSGWRR